MDFPSSNPATTSSYSVSETSCLGSCSVNDCSRRINNYPAHRAEFNETKSRLPKQWIDVLEDEFRRNQRPTTAMKSALAKCMNVKEAQVINWFQNRRARFKRELRSRQQEQEWHSRMNLTTGWATDSLQQIDSTSPCCQTTPQASYVETQTATAFAEEEHSSRQNSQLQVDPWQSSTSPPPTPTSHSQILDGNAAEKGNDSACIRCCQDGPIFCIVLRRCRCDASGQYRCAVVGASGDMIYTQSHCTPQKTPIRHESDSIGHVQELSAVSDLQPDVQLGIRDRLALPTVGSQCNCCQANATFSSGTAPQQPASEPLLSPLNDLGPCLTTNSSQELSSETHARELDHSTSLVDTSKDRSADPVAFHSTHEVGLYQDEMLNVGDSRPIFTSESSLSPLSTSRNEFICLAPPAGLHLGDMFRASQVQAAGGS